MTDSSHDCFFQVIGKTNNDSDWEFGPKGNTGLYPRPHESNQSKHGK